MTMRLLLWGWILIFGFVPELVANWLFSLPTLRPLKTRWYWRHMVAVAGAGNIFMLMVANLVGFSIGAEGMADYLLTVLQPSGVPFLLGTFSALFAAVHLMQLQREAEKATALERDRMRKEALAEFEQHLPANEAGTDKSM